jgi:hypothetical protein
MRATPRFVPIRHVPGHGRPRCPGSCALQDWTDTASGCAGHNVVMTPLGVWLTITTTVTVGILLGVVLSWIDPPSWATPLRLAGILVLAAAKRR